MRVCSPLCLRSQTTAGDSKTPQWNIAAPNTPHCSLALLNLFVLSTFISKKVQCCWPLVWFWFFCGQCGPQESCNRFTKCSICSLKTEFFPRRAARGLACTCLHRPAHHCVARSPLSTAAEATSITWRGEGSQADLCWQVEPVTATGRKPPCVRS